MARPTQNMNEAFLDALIRHKIYLSSYAGHSSNEINRLMSGTEAEMSFEIARQLESLRGRQTPGDWRRVQRLMKKLGDIRQVSWKQAYSLMRKEMGALSDLEIAFLEKTLSAVSPVVLDIKAPALASAAGGLTDRLMLGRTLQDWFQALANDDLSRVKSAIQAGFAQGDTVDTIIRRVIGSKTLKGADGVTELSRRQVRTIVRTVVSDVNNQAHMDFFQANADLFESLRFVATLDSRTSAICRALDGKEFPLGKAPRPPMHPNCRSLLVGVADKDNEVIGRRPYQAWTEDMLVREYAQKNKLNGVATRDDLPKGQKGLFDKWAQSRKGDFIGQVPANTTYGPWLKRQSAEFQDDVLGKTRGRLFRQGGLTIESFVDDRGRTLALSELARKDSEAFRAAGLDLSPDAYRKNSGRMAA